MNILDQLKRDEGVRTEMYLDSAGNLTIGVGHVLRGGHQLTDRAVDLILEDDVSATYQELLDVFPWMSTLSSARFGAMINMAFNLGAHGLAGFPKMLDALQRRDWDTAANEALDSLWAKQVGTRAQRVAQQIKQDIWV